jgi:hypothetical protein
MFLPKWDEAQVRFWKHFRELPDEEKMPILKAKVESILPLQGFTWVWCSTRPAVLGYEGPFRIKTHWKQWHQYAVQDDMVDVTYARQQTQFRSSDFRNTHEGRCIDWFSSKDIYGYLMGYKSETRLSGPYRAWLQAQFTKHNLDFSSWLPIERVLYEEAFFLQHFGIAAIARVFGEEWESFRAYVTAYEQAHATPNFPPTPPCP